MLKDNTFDIIYTSGKNEPIQFFFDAFIESKSLDLGLGFFNSSALQALSLGFAYFIVRGGKMRVIINDRLSLQDKEAIIKGQCQINEAIEDNILEDIQSLSSSLSKQDKHFFNCFSYLISQNRIEFIATVPKGNTDNTGIAHPKYGVFKDKDNNIVAFNGSANFSKNALYNNFESISCYCSWKGSDELERVHYFEEMFNFIWEGKDEFLHIIPIEKVKTYIAEEFSSKNISQLLKDEKELLSEIFGERKKKIAEYMLNKMDIIDSKPVFPFGGEARLYQKKAYENWINNDYKGIFNMATGTGKTITALNCVLEECKKNDNLYQAIIVVPTQALALQWEKEVSEFNFQNVISTHTDPKWIDRINRLKLGLKLGNPLSFIIITTYATFNKKKFQTALKELPELENLIYIADEAHNLGANTSLKNVPYQIKKRIGLSATFERIYDEHGTNSVSAYFNSFSPNHTYNFTMKRAIEEEVLCEYYYYPILVELEEDELKEYLRISKQLMFLYDSKKKIYKKEAEQLLMKRKRIIHKARNKKAVLRQILEDIDKKRGNLSYTFVYVPEGYEQDYSKSDITITNLEDIHIIDEYAEILNQYDYKTYRFVGGLKESETVLTQFANNKIDVLLSMKCLDEGVDIPRAETAIFCSSTGNPRQFIQRRGRILRNHKDKKFATIYDMVVVPPLDQLKDENSTELSILKNELYRVANFIALSKPESRLEMINSDIAKICELHGINIYEMINNERLTP